MARDNVIPLDFNRPPALPRADSPLDEAYEFILCQPRERWERLFRHFGTGNGQREEELRRLVHTAVASGTWFAGMVVARRYELKEELGHGNFASVWRARDSKIDADVALKLFRAPASNQLIRQAVREARAAAQVRHGHVIRIYDVVVPEDGVDTAYISMELVGNDQSQGVALSLGSDVTGEEAARVKMARPRDAAEAARWVAQAARGLEAAHARGIHHRDIKPANILLDPVDRTIRVTDFGLATQQAHEGASLFEASNTRITLPLSTEGGPVGTSSYMAPEMAAGLTVDASTPEGRQVLARIDIFGLGATLFELLTGRPPYLPTPEAAPETRVDNVLAQAREGWVPSLEEVRPRFKVSSRLLRILDKALAKQPERRYGSVGVLAEDLEAFLADRLASTDAFRPHLKVVLLARRNPLWVGNIVAGLCLGIVGMSLWVAQSELDLANVKAKRLEHQAVLSEQRDEDAKRQFKQMEEKIAGATQQLHDTEARNRLAIRQLNDSERRLDVTRQKMNSALSEARHLDIQVVQTRLEADSAYARLGEAEKLVTDMKTRVSALESALTDARGRMAHETHEKTQAQREVSEIAKELSQAQQQLRDAEDRLRQVRDVSMDSQAVVNGPESSAPAVNPAAAEDERKRVESTPAIATGEEPSTAPLGTMPSAEAGARALSGAKDTNDAAEVQAVPPEVNASASGAAGPVLTHGE